MTWCVPPYDRAIAELVAYVRATWSPLGIVVSGSIVRGEGGPTSDLDVNIVHAAPWRLREQRRFAGVPTELFVNPPAQIRRYFESEHAEGRPCSAHMFATGEILAPHAEIDELVREARDWLTRPLAFTPAQLASKRYAVIDLIDDARDVIAEDPVAAHLLLAPAVEHPGASARSPSSPSSIRSRPTWSGRGLRGRAHRACRRRGARAARARRRYLLRLDLGSEPGHWRLTSDRRHPSSVWTWSRWCFAGP